MRLGPSSAIVRQLVRDTGCTVAQALQAAVAARGNYYAAFHMIERLPRVPHGRA